MGPPGQKPVLCSMSYVQMLYTQEGESFRMKVYFCMSCPEGELYGYEIFSTKELAEEWCKRENERRGYTNWPSHAYDVQEIELDSALTVEVNSK